MVSIVPQFDIGELLGGSASQGFIQGLQDAAQKREAQRKSEVERRKALSKRYQRLGDTATNFISKHIKEFDPYMGPEDKEALQQRYLDLLSQAEEAGLDADPNQLLQMALKRGKEQEIEASTQSKPDFFSSEGFKERGQRFSKEHGYDKAFENVMSLLKERPSAAGTEALIGGTRAAEGLASLADPTFMIPQIMGMLSGKGAPKGPLQPSEVITPSLREGLSPESQKGAQDLSGIYELLSGLVPLERVASGVQKGFKGAGSILDNLLGKIGAKVEPFGAKGTSVAAREASINAEGILSGSAAKTEAAVEQTVSDAAKEMAPAQEKTLAGRVTEKVPKPATVARVARQEALPFQKEAEMNLRETQLKEYPKYEEEILKDREEMLARRAAQEPKTERGVQGRAQRQAAAEVELPAVQRVYQNTSARVRALEDQLVSQPGNAQVKEILEIAKGELKDAEFLYKQTIENAKLGGSRAGKEAMREAARKKTMDIAEKIANGEEVELAKMDYNPEFIKQAKGLTKRKPLKAKKTQDFHTQVHDEYGNVYRQRLSQLDDQIKDLAKNKSLASLHQRQVLDKERQVIRKLIDHVDAESAIHRHKLGLRERFERQKAASRFKQAGKSTPVKETQKTKEAVKGKFDMRNATQEASKSPEQASKTAENVMDEAVRQNPKQAESIGKQKEEFKKSAAETQQEAAKEGETLAETIKKSKSQEEVKKAIEESSSRFRKWWEGRKKAFPRLGMSFLYGLAADTIQNSLKEFADIKIPSKYLYYGASAGFGFKGTRLAAPGTWVSGAIWHQVRKSRAKSAIKSGNRQETFRLEQKYGKKLMNEAKKEVHQSRNNRTR